MKKITVDGIECRVRKISVEFSPYEKSGIAGVTISFDKPVNGSPHRQYLPKDEAFKKIFSKIKYRKMITDYLELEFSGYDVQDAALDVPSE
jgi:hypothetical protein